MKYMEGTGNNEVGILACMLSVDPVVPVCRSIKEVEGYFTVNSTSGSSTRIFLQYRVHP